MRPIPGTITDPAVTRLLRTGNVPSPLDNAIVDIEPAIEPAVSDRDPGDEQPEPVQLVAVGFTVEQRNALYFLVTDLLRFAEEYSVLSVLYFPYFPLFDIERDALKVLKGAL